jgi:hypothetical protein
MSAAATSIAHHWSGAEPRATTLLALVRAIGEVTDDEREVVATVLHMLRSGEVRLCGNFRDIDPEELA